MIFCSPIVVFHSNRCGVGQPGIEVAQHCTDVVAGQCASVGTAGIDAVSDIARCGPGTGRRVERCATAQGSGRVLPCLVQLTDVDRVGGRSTRGKAGDAPTVGAVGHVDFTTCDGSAADAIGSGAQGRASGGRPAAQGYRVSRSCRRAIAQGYSVIGSGAGGGSQCDAIDTGGGAVSQGRVGVEVFDTRAVVDVIDSGVGGKQLRPVHRIRTGGIQRRRCHVSDRHRSTCSGATRRTQSNLGAAGGIVFDGDIGRVIDTGVERCQGSGNGRLRCRSSHGTGHADTIDRLAEAGDIARRRTVGRATAQRAGCCGAQVVDAGDDRIQLRAVNSIGAGGRNHACRNVLDLALSTCRTHRHHTIGRSRCLHARCSSTKLRSSTCMRSSCR